VIFVYLNYGNYIPGWWELNVHPFVRTQLNLDVSAFSLSRTLKCDIKRRRFFSHVQVLHIVFKLS